MKKNNFSELSNEDLLKKHKIVKSATIGLGICFIIAILILLYILIQKEFKNINIATILPVFMMPITFTPLLLNLGLIKKEIKSRNL